MQFASGNAPAEEGLAPIWCWSLSLSHKEQCKMSNEMLKEDAFIQWCELHPFCGSMIFEFKEESQAEVFVATVKKGFGLDGRAFDDPVEAGNAHAFFPRELRPPVVLIKRASFTIERRVEKLARKFGGSFVGT
jgi:hypothetical protein